MSATFGCTRPRLGTILPFDEVLAGYDPSAHTTDDFFGNKLAFVVPELPPDDARAGAWRKGTAGPAPVGRGASAERFSSGSPGGQPGDRARERGADQYIAQYTLDAPLLDGKASALSAQTAPALALEPARRDQSELFGGSCDRPAQARMIQNHGADRHADDPAAVWTTPPWTGTRTPTP